MATLNPKPDIAPKRAAIVGIRQTTARKPSQLKKKAMILLEYGSNEMNQRESDTYKAIRNVQSVPTSMFEPEASQADIAAEL